METKVWNRIGLFGGTFDPVHFGHLLVAQCVQEELCLDALFFIPAARSPFKPEREPAPAHLRLRWLRLALAGRSSWFIDEQELQRTPPSYTIDTVRNYIAANRAVEIFYIIGADHVSQLPRWREAHELRQLVEFVVVTRPGENAGGELPLGFRIRFLKGIPYEVSSSELRRRIANDGDVSLLTPSAVAQSLRNEHTYRN